MPHEAARRVSLNTMWLLTGSVCRMALSLALILLVARLGVAEFGSYSLGVHYFELGLSLTTTAVGIYLTREAARRPRRLGELLAYALALSAALAGVFGCLMLGAGRLLGYSATTRTALAIGSAALLPAAAASAFEAAFIAQQRAATITLGTSLESIARLGLSFAALALGGGVRELFLALAASRVLQAAFYAHRLAAGGTIRWRFARRRFGHFVRQWRVFAGENWLATLHTSLDVVILSALHGERAVGIYDAAYKIVRLGSVVARSYTTAVFPVMTRLAGDARESFLRLSGASLRLMLAVVVPAGVACTLLADRIIASLYDAEYAPAATVLRVLVWAAALECINPFLSYTLFAQGAQRRSLAVAAISLATNALITPLLAARYGAAGAAAGALLAALVAACCYAGLSMQRATLAQLGVALLKAVGAGAALCAGMAAGLPDAWLAGTLLGAAAYAATAVALRLVTVNDLRALRGAGGAL